MNDQQLLYLCVPGIAFFSGLLKGRHQGRRRPLINPGAVYIKCRDCGREHAVYPDGKTHALRSIDEVRRKPSIDEASKNPSFRFRRPGIED